MWGAISTGLISNQRPPVKRHRTDALESAGPSRRPGCAWAGCRRPGRLENGGGNHDPFCGRRHWDYGMADRFDMLKNGGAHVTQQPSGICKLFGCCSPVWMIDCTTGEAYDFCRRKHAVRYQAVIKEQWEVEGRLCQFQGCNRHVEVHETAEKVGEYCCLDHEIEAAGARGREAGAAKRRLGAAAGGVSSLIRDPRIELGEPDCGQAASSGDEIRQNGISQEAPQQDLQAKIEKERGYHCDVPYEYIESCLRHLLEHPGDFQNADPLGLFCFVNDITQSHPFYMVTGFKPRYFVSYIMSVKRRRRKTSDGCKWKHSGPPYPNQSTSKHVKTRYFGYIFNENDCSTNVPSGGHLLASLPCKEGKKRGDKKGWKMHEYSLADLGKESNRGSLPGKIPIISKIFQEKKGLPVFPPLKEKENGAMIATDNNGPCPVATGSEVRPQVEERTKSSISSNTAIGEDLLQGSWETSGAHDIDDFMSTLLPLLGE